VSAAACAGHPEPLWDAQVYGETAIERRRRQTRALRICRGCPIRTACAAGIDLRHDDGIMGGIVLPTILDKDRRSWETWESGHSGFGELMAS
jgi:hypothetical protein